MANVSAGSADHRSQVHTEVRTPIEAVLARVVMFVFGAIEVLIAVRFVLELLGANAAARFVKFVYGLSDVFMTPFVAILGTARVAGATFEWSALLALAVYALVAWGAVALIRTISPRDHAETVERVVKSEDTQTK